MTANEQNMFNNYKSRITDWVRPSEIDGKGSFLGTAGKFTPGGINQGSLGDCWFLASASSLAEESDRMQRVFTNTGTSKNGAYEVTFYHKGQPVKQVVDDKLPVMKRYNRNYLFNVK